jgi:polyisoprenoid-binding protein YceI
MKRTILFSLIAGLLGLSTAATAADWAIDKSHSNVGFKVKHLVISSTEGEFTDYDGTISFDPADLSTMDIEFTVQVASINTDNEDRDGHLKGADFLDVETYPTMTFKSTGVKVSGDDKAELMGDLTIRGITKPVTFMVEGFNQAVDFMGSTKVGGTASTTINRQDFGVSWSKTMDTGGLVVGDDVKIELELELNKK